MNRQETHLTSSPEEALKVGRRHSDSPVLISVDTRGMIEDGYEVTKRGKFIYTTPRVPPEYLEVDDI